MNFLLNWIGLNNLNFNELLWVSFGTLGQIIFFSRWVIQWYYSEKFNTSLIPIGFWWCSFFGGVITLVYAHHIASFPFMLAQGDRAIIRGINRIGLRRDNFENAQINHLHDVFKYFVRHTSTKERIDYISKMNADGLCNEIMKSLQA